MIFSVRPQQKVDAISTVDLKENARSGILAISFETIPPYFSLDSGTSVLTPFYQRWLNKFL